MRKHWALALGLPVALGAGLLFMGNETEAADHLDSPGATADPAADINDLYVFRSEDTAATGDRTVFVMTVFPQAPNSAAFSDAVEYKFVIDDGGTNTWEIICTADNGTPQNMTCNLGPQGGTATATDTEEVGAISADNADDLRIFAGFREDPFFFDLVDFQAFQATCGGTPVTCDPATLIDGSGGSDTLMGANVLAIVVDVNNTQFSSNVLNVYSVTTRM